MYITDNCRSGHILKIFLPHTVYNVGIMRHDRAYNPTSRTTAILAKLLIPGTFCTILPPVFIVWLFLPQTFVGDTLIPARLDRTVYNEFDIESERISILPENSISTTNIFALTMLYCYGMIVADQRIIHQHSRFQQSLLLDLNPLFFSDY